MPAPSFSPEESVRVQLDSLSKNDEPWPNHGLQTMYEFGLDVGGLDRSMYFGFPKDLYHFDHFMGMFQNRLGPLVFSTSYTLQPEAAAAAPGTTVAVVATVIDRAGSPAGQYRFELEQKQLGRKKGAWMTKSLVKLES